MNCLGVLFDLDGTLIRSYEPHIDAWAECCRRRGLSLDRGIFIRTFGGHNSEIIPVYWEAAGFDVPTKEEAAAIAEEKESLFREIVARDFPFAPGSRELVARVRSAGLRMAIASNAPAGNVELAARSFHPHLFDALASGDDVRKGKPDPGIFLVAAKRLGIEPSACLVIEDSTAGVRAARAAGMRVIAIQNELFSSTALGEADLIVESLDEIDPARLPFVARELSEPNL